MYGSPFTCIHIAHIRFGAPFVILSILSAPRSSLKTRCSKTMTDISDNGSEEPTSSRLEFIESENKLLLNQQNNYKELCMVLTERHVEILKYLNYLKKFIGKVISMNTEDSIGIFGTYPTDKLAYEGNIVKLDKQVQSIAESIQCSQAQISGKLSLKFIAIYYYYFLLQIMKRIYSKNK